MSGRFKRVEGEDGGGVVGAASEFTEAYADRPRGGAATATEVTRDIFKQRLGDIPQRELVTIESLASIQAAVTRMNEAHVGCVLVVEDDKLVGIFTERDVLTKVACSGIDPARTPVADVMTPDPDTLPASASIAFALQRMSVAGFRHIPLVEDDGAPVAVVSVRDIVEWMVELFPARLLNLPPEPQGYPRTVEGG